MTIDHFNQFVAAVGARLEQGRREYGDRSFSRHPLTLLREIEEEIEDIAGWAYVMHRRVKQIREALEEVER